MINKIKYLIKKTLINFLIIFAIYLFLLPAIPYLKAQFLYYNRDKTLEYDININNTSQENAVTAKPIKNNRRNIIPASKNFSIIINKLGINLPVIPDVDSSSIDAYNEALRFGVAHALGTKKPGQKGNVYIHGHSSLGYWELGNYAMAFSLLNKLKLGDEIDLVFQNELFKYKVENIEIVPKFDIYPLVRDFPDDEILTLQTCDPPGTTLNRLIITSKRIN